MTPPATGPPRRRRAGTCGRWSTPIATSWRRSSPPRRAKTPLPAAIRCSRTTATANQTLVDEPGAGNRVKTRMVYDGRGMLWKRTTGQTDQMLSGGNQRTTITEFDTNGNLRRVIHPAGVDADTAYATAVTRFAIDAAAAVCRIVYIGHWATSRSPSISRSSGPISRRSSGATYEATSTARWRASTGSSRLRSGTTFTSTSRRHRRVSAPSRTQFVTASGSNLALPCRYGTMMRVEPAPGATSGRGPS
jgi:hypothetical protein